MNQEKPMTERSSAPAPATSRRRFIDWLMSRTLTTWLLSTSLGGLVLAVIGGVYVLSHYTGERGRMLRIGYSLFAEEG